MDLLLTPELKKTYDKCKYKVKLWEHQFKKQQGRLPSKLDIREADNSTRFAYKTYFNLKSAVLEESFQDIEGFSSDEDTSSTRLNTPSTRLNTPSARLNTPNVSDVAELNKTAEDVEANKNTENTWGTHLNNSANIIKQVEKEDRSTVNSSFSQKLFKNSNSFSKRNPRKSLSFHHRNSETSINNSSKSLSQPVSSNSGATESLSEVCDGITIFNRDRVKITSLVEPVQSKSLNVVQSVLESNFTSKRNIDAGWMQRVALNTGTKLINSSINENNFSLSQSINNKTDYCSEDDIIDDSDEDVNEMHIAKKRLICKEATVGQKLDFSNIFNKAVEISQMQSDLALVEQAVEVPPKIDVQKSLINVEDGMLLPIENGRKKSAKKSPAAKKPGRTVKVAKPKDGEKITKRQSNRSRKTIVELQPEIDEDPFANDIDPDFDPTVKKQQKFNFDDGSAEEGDVESKTAKASKTPKLSKAKIAEKEEEAEDENAPYILEYSIKPRIRSVPRENLQDVLRKASAKVPIRRTVEIKDAETGVVLKDKRQRDVEKLEKKIATGNLNENFVRVDLKRKIYARGKKTMTFSKHKKRMWKQHKKNNALAGPDMNMGGCDGGKLTCFNCGQVGHFAEKCQATKGDKLLPLSLADQEYCPYPTLDEASEMATESQLAIRKPKNLNEKENETEMCSTSDDSDDPFDDELLAETMKLEEYVNKIDMQQYIDETRIVKPYYDLNKDGSIIQTTHEVLEVLHQFGHTNFRPGQEKAIMRILSGQSTLVTLSTGSGKSLCYQLPAYMLAKRSACLALIISPLVSLMEDQVTGLPAFLKAACLHTNKTKVQREKILEAINEGNLDILLVSPEAVVAGEKSSGFGSLLRKLPPISFACIDEAHCVSQWSHNFRPSYLMICRILKERLGVQTILGLTATATMATSDSIIEHLSIPDGRDGIITDTPLPDNLRLTVSKDFNRDNALLGLLLSERFADLKSVIIYCIRRQECERIAAFLRTSLKHSKPSETNGKKRKKTIDVEAEPYHAGLSASRRRTIQNKFMRGDLRIVVATVAFGMGINKSDIRAVIHYNLPKNFESYVQEVGRAGRDGLPAHCHLFLDSMGRDENELKRHIYSNSLDRHVIRKLLQKIFIPCSCKSKCPKHEVAFSINDTVLNLDMPEENISTLLCYLELHAERYIEVLSPAYVTCRVIAYAGRGNAIRKAAKDCPPLAMALAMFANKEQDENTFEFPIVDVAAAMGWDSGVCKHKLKNLEWATENNQPKRSLLTVQFSNLGFRLLAPGNLTGDELDDTLDRLHQSVVDQERTALLQLHALHEAVTSIVSPTYRTCISDEASEKEMQLKSCIRTYFDSPKPLAFVDLKEKDVDEGELVNDIRSLLNLYGKDNKFTGRAIARIFFGIQSPNYPAIMWGRCKFWRTHINSDFNAICRLATKEILKMK